MSLIIGLGILVAILCAEGMLLAVLLLHVAGLDEFDVEFWSVFKLGMAGGLAFIIARLLAALLVSVAPAPLAVLAGFAGASVVLGYFLSYAYGTEIKKTSIAMVLFIVINVAANLALTAAVG